MRFEAFQVYVGFVFAVLAIGFLVQKPFPNLIPAIAFIAIGSGMFLPALASIKRMILASEPVWRGYHVAFCGGLLLLLGVFFLISNGESQKKYYKKCAVAISSISFGCSFALLIALFFV